MECPFCHAPYSEGALFCGECGTYLLEDSKGRTEVLGSDWPGEAAAPFLTQESDPAAIRLNIGRQGRQMVLPLDQVIHLGRVDPDKFIFPEVDLTDDGGQTAGVSRRHVRISKHEALVMIEDLGSLNGTFVNGRRLAAYAPAVVSHGDYVQLGRLVIQILFEDEEELFQEGQESGPQARQDYIEQRMAHLFELYEGGLSYLEWVPPESSPDSKLITHLIGEMLPLPRLAATLIGRYPDAGLQLSSRRVSGHHCRIFYADYRFFIEDLASTNGTFINKVKLPAYTAQLLQHGDSIRVGDIQLFFQDRLAAFLAELKSPVEWHKVIEGLKRGAGQNLEAALTMLATLLQHWTGQMEAGIVEAAILLAYNLLEDRPLAGVELLLKTIKPGERRTPGRFYWALSRLMTQTIDILPESLTLVIRLAADRPVILLHRISQATPPGDFKNFFKVCETLFSQGDYTRSDLERLINNLKYLSEGVEANDRLSLSQTLFKMLNANSIATIAAFRSFQFVKKASTPPTQAVQWLPQLVKVSQAAHQAGQANKPNDRLACLTKAITVLNELERETRLKPQKPELTLYSEILFRWRWIILSEQDQLRGH